MPITMLGTVALDSIETPLGKHARILGGSATYGATAARVFSQNPINIVSIVGQDFPDEHHGHFNKLDINTAGITIGNANTFHWEGKYEGDMSQAITIATDLNVLLEFDPVIPEEYQDSRFVFCANFDPDLQKKALSQFKDPKLVVLDTMNFWIETKLESLKEVFKLTDVLIINDQELKLLTGDSNILKGIPKILEMGPSRVIVKKGEHGAIMATQDSQFITPAFPLDHVVDPTGAGDSFAGGFIGYLSKKGEMTDAAFREAVLAGTLVSSFTVQGFSLESLKSVDESSIKNRFETFVSHVSPPALF